MIRNALTVAETAARLGCSTSKVFKLLKAGDIRRAKSVGKATLVRMDTIEALEASLMPRVVPAKREPAIPMVTDELADARALAEFKKELRARKA